MNTIQAEQQAMLRALHLAASPGVPLGPNPRVGCVLLDEDGTEIAEGFHRGAGTPHAEVIALSAAGDQAQGATAVVTLEPCNHSGLTGPCVQALIAAGVRRVVFAQPDPNPVAAGGSAALQAAGVAVEPGLMEHQARKLNRAWTFALEHRRPFVTWKFAATLDGRSAASDGSSRWISNSRARRDVHRLRGECDVILAGTGTIETDDPALTVRDEFNELAPHQPLRAAMGSRELSPSLRIFSGEAATRHLRTHDPQAALSELFELGLRHVFLEGGPTVSAAFLGAGLVDEIVAYLAPMLLGSGRPAVGDLGITTIADAYHFRTTDVTVLEPRELGEDACVRITMEGH